MGIYKGAPGTECVPSNVYVTALIPSKKEFGGKTFGRKLSLDEKMKIRPYLELMLLEEETQSLILSSLFPHSHDTMRRWSSTSQEGGFQQ